MHFMQSFYEWHILWRHVHYHWELYVSAAIFFVCGTLDEGDSEINVLVFFFSQFPNSCVNGSVNYPPIYLALVYFVRNRRSVGRRRSNNIRPWVGVSPVAIGYLAKNSIPSIVLLVRQNLLHLIVILRGFRSFFDGVMCDVWDE